MKKFLVIIGCLLLIGLACFLAFVAFIYFAGKSVQDQINALPTYADSTKSISKVSVVAIEDPDFTLYVPESYELGEAQSLNILKQYYSTELNDLSGYNNISVGTTVGTYLEYTTTLKNCNDWGDELSAEFSSQSGISRVSIVNVATVDIKEYFGCVIDLELDFGTNGTLIVSQKTVTLRNSTEYEFIYFTGAYSANSDASDIGLLNRAIDLSTIK